MDHYSVNDEQHAGSLRNELMKDRVLVSKSWSTHSPYGCGFEILDNMSSSSIQLTRSRRVLHHIFCPSLFFSRSIQHQIVICWNKTCLVWCHRGGPVAFWAELGCSPHILVAPQVSLTNVNFHSVPLTMTLIQDLDLVFRWCLVAAQWLIVHLLQLLAVAAPSVKTALCPRLCALPGFLCSLLHYLEPNWWNPPIRTSQLRRSI